MILTLKLLGGQEKEYELQSNIFTIGRSTKNAVCLSHDGLSREHCKVEVTSEGELIVTDLNSTNGVYISGKRLAPNTPTLYPTYLPISIGPIEGLSVRLTDSELYASISKTPSKLKGIKKKN